MQIGGKAVGELKGLGEQETSAFHTYTIEITEGTAMLVVKMTAQGDLDLAIKHGAPIESYGDQPDWDLGDNSTDETALLRVDQPVAGIWYVDVFNSLYDEEAIAYELTIE